MITYIRRLSNPQAYLWYIHHSQATKRRLLFGLSRTEIHTFHINIILKCACRQHERTLPSWLNLGTTVTKQSSCGNCVLSISWSSVVSFSRCSASVSHSSSLVPGVSLRINLTIFVFSGEYYVIINIVY